LGNQKGAIFSPLVLWIAIIQGFLYVNAHHFWGPDWPSDGVILYLFLETIFLGWLGTKFVPKLKVIEGVAYWGVAFIATVAIVNLLFTFILHTEWPEITRAEALPLVIYTIFFVTPVEELIFRDILPNEVSPYEPSRRAPILVFGTQVLFGVYHWAAYGGFGTSMIIVIVIGCLWVPLARRFSLYFTMGSHAAYNLCVLGILTGGIV